MFSILHSPRYPGTCANHTYSWLFPYKDEDEDGRQAWECSFQERQSMVAAVMHRLRRAFTV